MAALVGGYGEIKCDGGGGGGDGAGGGGVGAGPALVS